ncbi:MAG TPA: polysaccharide biosynthesis/export family protein, partial [Candidatus Cybelea sp.]|nr:polysaccharide biosynthesis/export family protein [Candidatus Cybelea sp.]
MPQPIKWRGLRVCFLSFVFGRARWYALLSLLAACRLFASDEPSIKSPGAAQPDTNKFTDPAVQPSTAASNAALIDLSSSMNVLDDKHALAIGDQVSFRIVEDGEDPKSLPVTDLGELEVPYVGRFKAVGKTCKKLAGQLKTELEKEYYIQATVIIAVNVMAKSRGRVYLVGPVHVPGPEEIPSDEVLTLSKAILRAGGFTDFADQKNVKVTRRSNVPGAKDETFTVNVAKVFD